MAVKVMEEVPSRRVTRSALQNGLMDSPLPTSVKSTTRRSKPKKKVKFVEPSSDDKVKNTSLVSDEGIDMSFTPYLSLPQTISRPVHKLKQVKFFFHPFLCDTIVLQQWSLWYSSKNKKASWNENQHMICTMATIEDFWHCYNQVMKHFFSFFFCTKWSTSGQTRQ